MQFFDKKMIKEVSGVRFHFVELASSVQVSGQQVSVLGFRGQRSAFRVLFIALSSSLFQIKRTKREMKSGKPRRFACA
jgi:hypothetical protein